MVFIVCKTLFDGYGKKIVNKTIHQIKQSGLKNLEYIKKFGANSTGKTFKNTNQ